MLKKSLTYTDFNNEEQTEDFYFNLSRAELMKLELSADGNSLQEQVTRIIRASRGGEIIEVLDNIIRTSYGERSADGKRFVKGDTVWGDFKACGAYDALFERMVTDAGFAAEFINGITASITPADTDSTPPAQQTPVSTPSQIARARSEAALQGHQAPKKADHEGSQIVDVVEPQNAPVPLTEAEIAALNVPESVKDQIRASQR